MPGSSRVPSPSSHNTVAAVAAVAQEFNAGDVGIAGGLQVLEPAVNHPTASETIKRSWDSFSMGLAKGSKGSKMIQGMQDVGTSGRFKIGVVAPSLVWMPTRFRW